MVLPFHDLYRSIRIAVSLKLDPSFDPDTIGPLTTMRDHRQWAMTTLQDNDPNGIYFDSDLIAEGREPLHIATLFAQLVAQFLTD